MPELKIGSGQSSNHLKIRVIRLKTFYPAARRHHGGCRFLCRRVYYRQPRLWEGTATIRRRLSVDHQLDVLGQVPRHLGYDVAFEDAREGSAMRGSQDEDINSQGGREVQDGGGWNI